VLLGKYHLHIDTLKHDKEEAAFAVWLLFCFPIRHHLWPFFFQNHQNLSLAGVILMTAVIYLMDLDPKLSDLNENDLMGQDFHSCYQH
jgi:hypothetical protein